MTAFADAPADISPDRLALILEAATIGDFGQPVWPRPFRVNGRPVLDDLTFSLR
jgi:hypothetical protein